MRRLFLFAATAVLAACSEPSRPSGQAQQGQKATQTAKVAAPVLPEAPVVESSAPPALALQSPEGPDAAPAGEDASVQQAQAEAPASMPADSGARDEPPLVRAINQASLTAARPPQGWAIKGVDPGLVRLQVLLDRAGFSPGVIDGKDGQNVRQALSAYAAAMGLDEQAARAGLGSADSAAAAQTYVITAEDEAGPFIGDPPKDYEAMSKLPALAYSSPLQALAEKFHMDQRLLQALNPDTDWSKAGAAIVVAAPRTAPRAFQAARIEIDKSKEELRVYDAGGALVAWYPASVGSAERPAPSGVFKVVAVAPHPAYFYDPKRLTFTPEGAKGKLRIAPGPNNPVGEAWIALDIPTYGIHGSPEPATIGKRQSHGCVRLTNWDAVELGKAVKKGVKVEFVGQERKA